MKHNDEYPGACECWKCINGRASLKRYFGPKIWAEIRAAVMERQTNNPRLN